MIATYDRIGAAYATTRRPDPRIARLVDEALGDAVTVVNVGAGTGNYEPAGRRVVAVEPSETMIRQRPRDAAPAVVGRAEALPLADASVDAALAVLTVHHWDDPRAGLRELRRVARERVVVLTWDPDSGPHWPYEYFPGLQSADVPPLARFADALGPLETTVVPVPHDCADGFLLAWWRRPEAYLDPAVRANISAFALLPPDEVAAGAARLDADLRSGAWDERHGHLRALDAYDGGYRLLVATGSAPRARSRPARPPAGRSRSRGRGSG